MPQPTRSAPADAAVRTKPKTASSVTPAADQKKRVVTAKYRNHVWHVDLSAVPILGVGKQGRIAVVERFILTMKTLCTRAILVPLRLEKMRKELHRFQSWYNSERPHRTLKGVTPDEVYHAQHPRCRYPRFEPRAHWPRGAPCGSPCVPIRGSPGQRLELQVEHVAGREHLPIVTLHRAA